jgi:cytochrome c peroxidase
MTWEALAQLSPAEIRERDIFPYKALPHAAQGGGLGGQVFPQMQIKMFPRLERYDVEFDLPEAFLPEFPPAMFLQNRPELGDVSRGEVVSINNYYRLFKDILTAVQLDGLRLLVTPFPQEEFNPTDDRKTAQPSLGVTCLDCHVNGHTTGQFHITPDIRPEQRRIPPSVSAACSIKKFTGRSGAYARSRTLPSLSSAPLTSMAMRFTPSRKA